jgi:hypothetical protein
LIEAQDVFHQHHVDVLVTTAQRQVVLERLFHRNCIRQKLGGRPMDIPTSYKRKVRLMTEDHYMQLLEPLLVEKFAAVDWPTGFTPRLLLAVRLHRDAVAELERVRGISDPRTTNPDMLKIIERLVSVAPGEGQVIPLHDGVAAS